MFTILGEFCFDCAKQAVRRSSETEGDSLYSYTPLARSWDTTCTHCIKGCAREAPSNQSGGSQSVAGGCWNSSRNSIYTAAGVAAPATAAATASAPTLRHAYDRALHVSPGVSARSREELHGQSAPTVGPRCRQGAVDAARIQPGIDQVVLTSAQPRISHWSTTSRSHTVRFCCFHNGSVPYTAVFSQTNQPSASKNYITVGLYILKYNTYDMFGLLGCWRNSESGACNGRGSLGHTEGGGGGGDRHVMHGDSHVSLLLVDISQKILGILVYINGILCIVAPYMFSS